MARKPNKAAAAPKVTAVSDDEIPVIRETQFRQLVGSINASKRKITSETGTIRQSIAQAAKDRNLHPVALAIWKRIDDMEPMRRSEMLYHFKLYQGWSDWEDQEDLWRRQRAEMAQTEGQERRSRERGNGGQDQPEAA